MTVKNESVDKEKLLEQFLKIGLDERTARNTVANNKVTANLNAVIHEAGVLDGCDRAVGNLLYTVATKYPTNALIHRPVLLQYITSNKVKMPAQLEAAFSFLSAAGPEIKLNEFENACGVGVEVSVEEIEQTVNEVFEEHKNEIMEQRYRTNVGDFFGQVRKKHPWADPKIVKQFIDSKLFELLGERTVADNEKIVKKKKEKPAKVDDKLVATVSLKQPPSEEDLNPYLIFPQPEDNFKVHTEVFFSDGTVLRCCNTRELLEKHLKATGGRVLTRFPPEPNGYLHIGHAKAMFVDFGLAKERGGGCYLRYDDTNPEAEKKEYIDHIEEIVKWMGWEPFKITYASDYFQDLYELAVELIRRGHAYVDHQTPDEIKEYREKKMNSPWRDRPVAESLKLFDEMKQGLIEEGKATLRMKQDMQSDNFNMYDLIAYRVKFTPHPHAGDKWCIYPSYDFAHCTVDSLENITHSLCTLEFETRRASYYWLLHALDLYQPYVWEYSRLNVSNNVLSKRKLNRLVTEKWVDGWDDPRLLTLAGLRRRGVTSTAINAFVRGMGITRSDCSLIRFDRLEYHIREELNRTAARAMVVLHPLKVVITNFENGSILDLDAKKWPEAQGDEASAFYKVPFSNIVYIEQSDFRLKDSKDYYGLAPGKSVLLRYAYPIKCTDVILADDKETVLEIRAEYDASKKSKPKKRVSEIYKKYKSSMSSEDTGSSPWNVAPAAPSPEAASPWAVSPFQTSNPFKSPESPPTPSETEPEPDVVNSAVMEDLPTKEESSAFSTAFEPAADEAPAASSAWVTAPVAETQETTQPSAWTSAATETVEKVQEPVKEVVQQTPEPVVQEEVVVEKDVEPEVPLVEETASSAWAIAPAQEEPSASAWTAAPVQEEAAPIKVEETVEKAPVKEADAVEEPIAVKEVATPVEEHIEEVSAAVVEEVAEEEPSVASSAWTTAPVQEDASSVWTTAPVQEEAAKAVVVEDVTEVEPADVKQVAEEATVKVAEPVVEAAQVEAEESASAASPWTSAPVQEEVAAVAETVKEIEPVKDTPAPVVEEVAAAPVKVEKEQTPASIVDSPTVEEELLPTSAWNTMPTQDEAVVKKAADTPAVVEPIVETPEPVVETPEPVVATPVEEEAIGSAWNAQPLHNAASVVESAKEEVVAAVEEVTAPVVEGVAVVKTKVEEEAPAASSALNSTPVQKEAKTVVVEKVVEPVKEVAAEPVAVVQKEPVVEIKKASDKEIVAATETVVKDAPLDKKAIANAFDGVDSYKVDSVVKVKKVPSVEAAAAKSADAPGACGACGIGGCSIM